MGNTYFFTVVTYKRQPIFCFDESRVTLREVISETRRLFPFEIKAWVLLPDHLHTIWELPEGDTRYSMRWGFIKKEFTKRLKTSLSTAPTTRSRLRKREGNIWQRRFWEHTIRGEGDYRTHFDYIHYNPVKHGLAARAGDWEYSTFHRYRQEGLYPPDWGEAEIRFPENFGGE
ncbi:MAG: transposase [Thermodesulfobacteriota bacterium]